MSDLKLWNNKTDTFVARDAAHATALWEPIYGALYNVEFATIPDVKDPYKASKP